MIGETSLDCNWILPILFSVLLIIVMGYFTD